MAEREREKKLTGSDSVEDEEKALLVIRSVAPNYPNATGLAHAAMLMAMDSLEALMPRKDWLIYSFEHGGWWGPKRSGYFSAVAGAGRYTATEVCQILSSSPQKPAMPVHHTQAADGLYPSGRTKP